MNAAFTKRHGTPRVWRDGVYYDGVSVANRASATSLPADATSAAVVASPVPAGTARLHCDRANETVTGVQFPKANTKNW
jgi:hypothetical protein